MMDEERTVSSPGTSSPASESAQARTGKLAFRNIVQMMFFLLAIKPFMALFIGLRVRGREHLCEAAPFILIANHSSHLDTMSLLSLFPLQRLRGIRPVAAADYFERNRFVSVLTKTLFNILPIARKKITAENNPLRRMREAIDAGDSIIIFPEGTRGLGQEMGEFRSGVAHLIEKMARRAGCSSLPREHGKKPSKRRVHTGAFFLRDTNRRATNTAGQQA